MQIRGDFVGNIILTGGSSTFEGFDDRMTHEMINLFPKTYKTRVIAPPERKFCVWIGASILGININSQ